MKQHITLFTQAFTHLYFLMLSADKIADIKELEIGNKIIKKEQLNKDEIMKGLDELSSVPRNEILAQSLSFLNQLPIDERLKCLAYISLVAKSDGEIDSNESELLTNLCKNELNISLNQVYAFEEQLQIDLSGIDD